MTTDDAGTAATTTVVMLPLLLIVLAAALELGALRAVAHRVAVAADLATLVAVNDQDESEQARTGVLRPSLDADSVARAYFALNLSPSAAALAATADAIAASADVAVYRNAPADDARTGAHYERPTVRIIATVPVRTPAFGALLLAPVTTITVRSASSAR